MKQVNYTTLVNGESYYWKSSYSDDGYVGRLIETRYSDGYDVTEYCVFVGSDEECDKFIDEHNNKAKNECI